MFQGYSGAVNNVRSEVKMVAKVIQTMNVNKHVVFELENGETYEIRIPQIFHKTRGCKVPLGNYLMIKQIFIDNHLVRIKYHKVLKLGHILKLISAGNWPLCFTYEQYK